MVKDRAVAAFCPGHISGYFKRVTGPDTMTTGSTGAGIVISEGVIASVRRADHTSVEIYREDTAGKSLRIAQKSPPVRFALDRMCVTAAVRTECRLPIGAGFGLSAAALLATITAVNQLYDLDLDERQIAHAAHEAEIVHRTGLGDVSSCRGGGMVVRTVAGIDAPVRRIMDLKEPVCAVSFGPITTPAILSSPKQMERVAAAYPAGEPGGIDEFFSLSREFALRSGLITAQVRGVLESCDKWGIPASMTMLGNGVFAYGGDAREVLSHSGEVSAMTVAQSGPVLLEEKQ